MNSRAWRFVISSSSVDGTGGFGSPNILGKALIPTFDESKIIHCKLAELSKAAHKATAAENLARVTEIEEELDEVAGKLWKLSEGELRDIQDSLSERC